MAYFEDHDGGRFGKNFDGPVGPRRPRMFLASRFDRFGSVSVLTTLAIGLVTDYGSSMVQWMRTRQPRYKGGHRLETERPSPSFAVDVRDLSHLRRRQQLTSHRSFPRWRDLTLPSTLSPYDTFISLLESQRNLSSSCDGLPKEGDC